MLVSFDPTSYTVTEGENETAVLSLVRSGDLSRATVVTVSPTPGTATGRALSSYVHTLFIYVFPFLAASLDYTPTPISVTFTAGQTDTTVEVPIIDNSVVEDTEIFTAQLSTTNPNVMFGEDSASVTILDNDGNAYNSQC